MLSRIACIARGGQHHDQLWLRVSERICPRNTHSRSSAWPPSAAGPPAASLRAAHQPDCPAGPPSLLPAPPPAEHAAPAQLQTSPAQCMAASTVTGASSCSPSKREPDESPLAVAAAAACAGRLLQAEASTCCCSLPHSRCLTDIRTACCIFGGHTADPKASHYHSWQLHLS